MRPFRSEPFLWIHFAGLAVLPLWLQLVWLGLAVGDPQLPMWLELLLVAAFGSIPIFWMQWSRPFNIFSLLFVALKPEQLTQQQRQILSVFKTRKHRFLTVVAAVVMLWGLWQLYRVAPAAAMVASLLPQWRIAGLVLAGLAFGASNLFLQVPVSVLGVLSTSEKQLKTLEPWVAEKIPQDFVVFGFRVGKILPTPATEQTE